MIEFEDYNFIVIKQVTRDFLDEKQKDVSALKNEIVSNVNSIRKLEMGAADVESNWSQLQRKSLMDISNYLHQKKEESQKVIDKYRGILDTKLIPFENLDHFHKMEPSHKKRREFLEAIIERYIEEEEYDKCSIVKTIMNTTS